MTNAISQNVLEEILKAYAAMGAAAKPSGNPRASRRRQVGARGRKRVLSSVSLG